MKQYITLVGEKVEISESELQHDLSCLGWPEDKIAFILNAIMVDEDIILTE